MQLTVEALTSGYPGHTAAVDGVDLTVPSGQVAAIVGPNGCGKSTLLRSISRLHKPSSGTVRAGDEDVWRLTQRRAAHRIALLAQSPQAPEAVTVAGLVRYGRHPHQGLFRQWSREDEAAVREALEATGTTDLSSRRLDHLSGGQRQRCWLAMVLAQQTPIVLLDEPTSALDLGHAVEVLSLVREVAAAGRTVVMVLHDLASAARYADTVVAMNAGKIVANGPAREVVTAELVKELYGIDADILQAPGDGSPVVVPTMTARVPGRARGGAAEGAPGKVPQQAPEATSTTATAKAADPG